MKAAVGGGKIMPWRVMSPEASLRALELAQKPYRPPIILALKAEIESEIRLAELAESITGELDPERVKKIVEMKIQLDGLYVDWCNGEFI